MAQCEFCMIETYCPRCQREPAPKICFHCGTDQRHAHLCDECEQQHRVSAMQAEVLYSPPEEKQ